MRKHHPNNERVKHEYLTFLEQAKRMSTSTVDQVAASLALFEESTGWKDFRTFHRNQAIAFKQGLQEAVNAETGKPLAKATVHSRLMAMKAFIHWLHGRPGFRSAITYDDAEYFNPSANDTRVARAHRQRPAPTLEQVRITFDAMPMTTIIERRDRALFAFALVSGSRDNALASFALKHTNLELRTVSQDGRDVRTKNAKTFVTSFFPVVPVYAEVVAAWIAELHQLGYGPNDPLFPATMVEAGSEHRFSVTGLKPEFWKSAGAVRRIFKEAFVRVGLPYFNPHSFRSTLAILGEKICRNAEQWRAYSQNFGHSSPMTTFTSYGSVAPHRQQEILNELAAGPMEDLEPAPVRLDPTQLRQIMDELARVNGQA